MPAPKLLILALLAFAAGTLAPAQQPAPPAQSGPQKIYLDVVVTPKKGKPVSGLTQQDFTVFDNNVAEPITGFQAFTGNQVPVEVVLVIDAVNTNIINMAYERQQIDKFLRANEGHLAHPISLAIFTDTGTQIQQAPTSDGNQLAASLDQSTIGLREIHRDSQYQGEDRVNLSLTTLQSLIARDSRLPGRKLIFWVSPGWPLLSGPRIELDAKQEQQVYSQIVGLSTALRRNNIVLYSIDPIGAGQNVEQEFYYQNFLSGVRRPKDAQLGDLSLQVFAVESGGLALNAGNDITSHIQQAMDDTESFYRISYDAPPAEQPNEYHKIDVKLTPPGLTARTRTGYYADPSPAR